jgi:hypothetical protein
VLGEARLRRLFDYLVESTLAGHSPKEMAIAVDVFGKSADFDVSQDALVRVYVHKLRRTLDEYYAAPENAAVGAGKRQALQLPKGEYRLRIVAAREPIPEPAAQPPSQGPGDGPHKVLGQVSGARSIAPRFGVPTTLGLGIGTLGVMALVVAGILMWRSPRSDLDRVRASPVWASLLRDDRPIRIVVGDYYLIGETDSMGVKRLIREYAVNSRSDLDQFVTEHPEVADRYMDVGLRYLPVSSAFALRDVMAILAPQNRRITISKMSDVEPANLKSDDIIYIGYLSGMGMLQDLVFTPESRFALGDSYDEVIDKRTKHSYVSEVGTHVMDPPTPTGREQSYHDYGMFAKIRGPGGNSIVVISGTRDEGVSETAETFTSNPPLQEFAHAADASHQIEALLEVSAFDGVNLTGKLLLESNREGTATVVSAVDARPATAIASGPPAAATAAAVSPSQPR